MDEDDEEAEQDGLMEDILVPPVPHAVESGDEGGVASDSASDRSSGSPSSNDALVAENGERPSRNALSRRSVHVVRACFFGKVSLHWSPVLLKKARCLHLVAKVFANLGTSAKMQGGTGKVLSSSEWGDQSL